MSDTDELLPNSVIKEGDYSIKSMMLAMGTVMLCYASSLTKFSILGMSISGIGLGLIINHQYKRIHRISAVNARESQLEEIDEKKESCEWLNQLVKRFWYKYEPQLSETIAQSVDSIVNPMFESLSIPGVQALRFTSFTLGRSAPRIDSILTFTETADDEKDQGTTTDPDSIGKAIRSEEVRHSASELFVPSSIAAQWRCNARWGLCRVCCRCTGGSEISLEGSSLALLTQGMRLFQHQSALG